MRPKLEIAQFLLDQLDDPDSDYMRLVSDGHHQAVLGYTYAKASLINIPPDLVRAAYG